MSSRFLLLLFGLIPFIASSQDSSVYHWKVSSKKTAEATYELIFTTPGNPLWELYSPNAIIGDVPASEISFSDSSVKADTKFGEEGATTTIKSTLFYKQKLSIYKGPATFRITLHFAGAVPEKLLGKFSYTYGKGEEFYPLNAYNFAVPLEGGVASTLRIRINSFDLKNPVSECGDEHASGSSLWRIFVLGLLGGFIGLLTPCVFPLIPLTVSFFTKKAGNRKQGVFNASLYGFFIFLIYILLSIPFHLVSNVSPEILNNLATNVWLSLFFFLIFVVFAISFFGYFEIGLPSGFANRVDSRSGMGTFGGIFFMALTLAIVSFSCTGPILGSLLAGTASEGAWPLTAGLAGFGLALALPFSLFAMFPGWLQSLPKSGGWLTSVKVVLGFLELAMALKFLSNADLVQQWGLIKRETFIAIWVIIGILILLYLLGKIRFPHDSPVGKISGARLVFVIVFAAIVTYLIPGLTNTRAANLGLISGFPPPLCYSLYKSPVNCEKNFEPLKDYEQAVALAKKENKPILIDFTGWACANCRRMEENVWTDAGVSDLMRNKFVVVSLYVDERKLLPAAEQIQYKTKQGYLKNIVTVGDRWATFQSENFNESSQPQYAIVNPSEKILTRTKSYTSSPKEFTAWLQCGIDAHSGSQAKAQRLR